MLPTLFSLLVSFSVFITSPNISHGGILAKYLYLDILIGISLTSVSIRLFRQKNTLIELSITDISILVFGIYMLAQCLIHRTVTTLDYINHLALFTTYYFLRTYVRKSENATITVVIIFLTTYFLQSVYGILQIIGVSTRTNEFYPVTGSFHNPGPFAIYLAGGVTLAITALCRFYKKNENHYLILKGISILVVFTSFIIIPYTESRTGWISLGAGFIFLYQYFPGLNKYLEKTRFKKILLLGFGLPIILICASWIYKHKQESADGRWLIWKVSSQMISEKPIFGFGPFSFSRHYSTFQSNYFACNNLNSKEIALADQVDYAYNDFIQLVVEVGAIGLVIFITILVSAFSNIHSFGIPMLVSCIVSSTTSYSLEGLPTSLNLLIALVLCANHQESIWKYQFRISKILAGIGLLISTWIIYFTLCIGQLKSEYRTAIELYENDQFDRSIEIFRTLDIRSQITDHESLSYYGKALALRGFHAEAILIYERALRSGNEYYLNLNYGISLEEMGQYAQAENYYVIANYMLPNRIYPKYLLSKLYARKQDRQKAESMAFQALGTSEKIRSQAFDELKNEMRSYVNQSTIYSAEP